MSENLELDFEYAVRQFLGDKAFGVAGAVQNNTSFRSILRDCVSVIRKQVMGLDTTTRHKEIIMREIEELDNALKTRKGGTEKEIIVCLFGLISRLFGFGSFSGHIYNQLFYHQNFAQFMDEQIILEKEKSFRDVSKEHNKNIITLRKETYSILSAKGFSDQLIAGVMGTTEYNIKKLKHDI